MAWTNFYSSLDRFGITNNLNIDMYMVLIIKVALQVIGGYIEIKLY